MCQIFWMIPDISWQFFVISWHFLTFLDISWHFLTFPDISWHFLRKKTLDKILNLSKNMIFSFSPRSLNFLNPLDQSLLLGLNPSNLEPPTSLSCASSNPSRCKRAPASRARSLALPLSALSTSAITSKKMADFLFMNFFVKGTADLSSSDLP